MSVSVNNLFNRQYHKIPKLLTVYAKVTPKADVEADGYTVNLGTDLIASVARGAEGVMVVTTKFPWTQLVGCEVTPAVLSLARPRYTSSSASAQTVTFTWETEADKTTDLDPDATVFFMRLDFNLSTISAV